MEDPLIQIATKYQEITNTSRKSLLDPGSTILDAGSRILGPVMRGEDTLQSNIKDPLQLEVPNK